MKRKVIQIAGSTHLISLPRAWTKRNNIQKGQELDVQEEGDKVVVNSSSMPIVESFDIDISRFNGMTSRCIQALYKRGIDELRVKFSKPESIRYVHAAINSDVVGFEILEQGQSHCVIKSVSGNTEEFDSILRRTFLLLLAMSDEFLSVLKNEDYAHLKNVAFLEQTNNRFTTVLRRHINKNGKVKYSKTGPIYYIIEMLEKIADQYKYTCYYLNTNMEKGGKIRKELIDGVQKANSMVRDFYELFYKFDDEKLLRLKQTRNVILEASFALAKKPLSGHEAMLIHHNISIAQDVFGMTGPYMVLEL
ncbi:hypothetical protein HY640_01280 [Candidatus Woesearchaeota archaeon]|nr:hypothetical protein [Candidatus Woesearchaeota archaeon]